MTPRAAQRGATSAVRGAPHPCSHLVERPRLVERLVCGTAARLTCVTAPAGFGKTALLAQWGATEHPGAVLRLALDSQDADPQHFANHLLQALATCWGEKSETMLERIVTGAKVGSRLIDAVVDAAGEPPETILVLEDVEALTASSVTGLGSLVAHAPDQLHVVLSSRSELSSVMRTVGRTAAVAAITAEDLAFDRQEIGHLGEQVGVELAPSDIEQLYAHTGGWPLAVHHAIHLANERGERDAAVRFQRSPDRWILGYVRHEVLSQMPERLRSFVLSTSVPDGFSAKLADALSGQHHSALLLEQLIENGILLNPQDGDPQHRFSYPPLLTECFRIEMRASAPGREEALLRKAADWHLAHGDFSQAVEYLLRAQAFDQVIEVLTENPSTLYRSGLAPAIVRWMRAIPETIRGRNARATLCFAAMCQVTGDAVAAEELLSELALQEQERPSSELSRWINAIYCLGSEHRSPAAEVFVRADQLLRGDEVSSRSDAVGHGPPIPHDSRSRFVSLRSSIAYVSGGQALAGLDRHEEAWRWFTAGLADPTVPPSFRVQLLGALARSEATVGRLHNADHHARQALALAGELDAASSRHHTEATIIGHSLQCAEAFLALGIVCLERANLPAEEATTFLAEAEHRARTNRRSNLLAAIVAQQARATLFTGRIADGLAALEAFRSTGDPDPPPAVAARLVAIEAELLVVAGDTSQAGQVLADADLLTAEVLAAHARLAAQTHDDDLLTRVVDSWPTNDDRRPRARTSRLLWQAISAQSHDDPEHVCTCLKGALFVAETQGLRQVFAEPGSEELRHLSHLLPSSARSELADLNWPTISKPSRSPGGRVLAKPYPNVEALSERERVVLRFLAKGLGNGELTAELFISTNTLKTHLKHIYRKLGVTTRLQAVLRAEHLGLLDLPANTTDHP